MRRTSLPISLGTTPRLGIAAAIALACAVGFLCGVLNGLVVTVGRVPAIVVTLGTLSLYRGIDSLIAGGRQVSADQVPQAWLDLTGAKVLGIPGVVLIALGVLAIARIVLSRLPAGRELYAIGSNPAGAELIGIRVGRRVLMAFAVAGLLAGFDGALWASRYATIDARVALGYELSVIAAVVVGGVAIRGGAGTVLGVALGAIVAPGHPQRPHAGPHRSALAAGRLRTRHPRGDRDRRLRHPALRSRTCKGAVSNLLQRFGSWEAALGTVTIVVILAAAISTPSFVGVFNLSQAAAGFSEKALLVLPMVLLIIAREIDLSVASILALSSVVLGVLTQASVPLLPAILLVLLVGALAGAFNGALVTGLNLPSLVVTLGTLALFRGIGYMILGSASVNVLPPALSAFGIDNVPGTPIPWTIVPFLVLAPMFALLLQRTATGRRIYAMGGNPDTALYSGVEDSPASLLALRFVRRVSSIAGIVLTARLSNARANNALGFELDVITIALLGGVSVFGGRGTDHRRPVGARACRSRPQRARRSTRSAATRKGS